MARHRDKARAGGRACGRGVPENIAQRYSPRSCSGVISLMKGRNRTVSCVRMPGYVTPYGMITRRTAQLKSCMSCDDPSPNVSSQRLIFRFGTTPLCASSRL